MMRILPLAVFAVVAGGCGSERLMAPAVDRTPALTATRTRSREVIPLQAPLINTCYNSGVGESIQLSGSIVLTLQTLSSSSGKVIETLHVTTQGVHGVGLSSGIRYQVMEHQNSVTQVYLDGSQSVQFVFSIRIIGAGPGYNELLTSRFRLLVAPDGTHRFVFDETDDTCR
jgi:hypothetical protein